MNIDRIDFISAYCDRWCERCAFTMRCSAFAVEAAVAMCDDPREAVELAVGTAACVDGTSAAPPLFPEFANIEMSAEDEREYDLRHAEHERRVEAHPISQLAHAVMMLAHDWLAERLEAVESAGDDVLREAIEVARHDAVLITAKLHRALSGVDNRDADDHPVQNDWNGSAKVALVCIERSEAAWCLIAQVTGDRAPAAVAGALLDLRRQVEETFPDARQFVRPGFDQPGI